MSRIPVICAWIALLLATIWTLLIGAVLLFLPKQPFPLSESLVEFGFAACEFPCWAGITPGFTSIGNVPALYEKNVSSPFRRLDSYDTSHNFFGTSTSGESLSGTALTSTSRLFQLAGRVLQIDFEAPLPMWYLISTLGAPTCVGIERFSGTMVQMRFAWSSPEYVAETSLYIFEDTDWGMEQSVISTHIYVPQYYDLVSQGAVLTSCESFENAHWLGFAPLSRYMAFLPYE